MQPNPQFRADLVTFTGEIVNGKLHFLCIENQTKSLLPKTQVVPCELQTNEF